MFSSNAFAVDTSKIEVRGSISDGTTTVEDSGLIVKTFTAGARQQQTLTLAAGATTVSIPSGSKGVLLDVGSVRSLHLKGVTGDKGISLDSSFPVMIPLSADATTTMLISNDGVSTTINAYWF